MLSVPLFLAVLACSLACLGAAAVVAGWLIAECLDERDRRRGSSSSAITSRTNLSPSTTH